MDCNDKRYYLCFRKREINLFLKLRKMTTTLTPLQQKNIEDLALIAKAADAIIAAANAAGVDGDNEDLNALILHYVKFKINS